MTVASLPYGDQTTRYSCRCKRKNPEEAPSGRLSCRSINPVNPRWMCCSGHQLIWTNPFIRRESNLWCRSALNAMTGAIWRARMHYPGRRGGELKWNVTFYSVPDCICLPEWHRPGWELTGGFSGRDINFTQMCPQWAWVHEWMNAHSHTYTAAKPHFEPLLEISLSLWLYCHYCSVGGQFGNEMSLTLVICMPIPTRVCAMCMVRVSTLCPMPFSTKHTHACTHTHTRVACSDTAALSRGLDGWSQAVVMDVWNVTGSQFYTPLCDQTNPFYGQYVSV